MSRSIPAGAKPEIHIGNIGGDLSLVGWDGADLLIKGDEDEYRLGQEGERFDLSSDGDLGLRVPKSASVFIDMIGGDAAVRGVMGALEIREIGGDLSVRDVGSVAIDSVHADFSLRGAKGDLSVKSVHSDASIRDVGGDVSLGSVADDLVLRDARGNVSVNVGEDVVLYLDPKADKSYGITAGDDILLVLPQNTDVTLDMHGDEINVDWPGIGVEDDVTERVVVLGDGSAKISLNAGGDVRVSNRADAGESADEFGNFAGINFDFSGFGDRINRRVEQVTQRAQRKMEEAARRIERKTREAGRQAPRHGRVGLEIGRWNWDLGSKVAPVQSGEAVSDEERMSILKMLQEKKITAEEAEKLLAALEGGA
jgi:hypothetical protein